MEFLNSIDFAAYEESAMAMMMEWGPKILLAIVILFIGFKFIKIFMRIWDKVMKKQRIEISFRRFLRSLVSIILKVVLLITVLSALGIKMTSFVAIFGAAGLAVGLALKGSLSNFAGGVMIIFFKPFRVGHYIQAQGQDGTVYSINIFSTILHTPDNKTIIIPNGDLSNSSIVNYSEQKTRRVDMIFGIGYDDDLKKAKDILNQLIKKDKRILEDPASFVGVKELADNSVNFVMKVWCATDDYWAIYHDMLENVKITFDKEGISIPYPQRDVHLYTEK